MKLLLTMDAKNYTDEMPVLECTTVRAVIMHDGKLAMQRSKRGEYKIPGGGVEPGETHEQTLLREVREETGLLIRPETIRELGEILELREDVFSPGQKYVCRSFFYACDVSPEIVATEMTEGEREKGYQPVWETPEKIIEENHRIQNDWWRRRDTHFLELLQAGEVTL